MYENIYMNESMLHIKRWLTLMPWTELGIFLDSTRAEWRNRLCLLIKKKWNDMNTILYTIKS